MRIEKFWPFLFLTVALTLGACSQKKLSNSEKLSPDSSIFGNWVDDYDIGYYIDEEVFILQPNVKYNILEWHTEDMYLLAVNDSTNNDYAGLYARIDYMELSNMEPFKWAFCITDYSAATLDSARMNVTADRMHPRTGCNGFPFSRMKPAE